MDPNQLMLALCSACNDAIYILNSWSLTGLNIFDQLHISAANRLLFISYICQYLFSQSFSSERVTQKLPFRGKVQFQSL